MQFKIVLAGNRGATKNTLLVLFLKKKKSERGMEKGGKNMGLKKGNKYKVNCSLCWGWGYLSPLPQLPASPSPSPGAAGERRRPSSFCLESDGLWQGLWDRSRAPQGTSGLRCVFGGKRNMKCWGEQSCSLPCGNKTLLPVNVSVYLYCSASCFFLFIWK